MNFKFIVKIFFLIVSVSLDSAASIKEDFGKPEILVGEEITYVVRYSFVKLGEIKLKVIQKKEEKGVVFYKTIAYIDSYESIPFISIHQIYESSISENLYSIFFRGTEKMEDYVKFTTYDFYYDINQVRVRKGRYNPYKLWIDSTKNIYDYYQDGLSLFYYARLNMDRRGTIDAKVYMNEKEESVLLNYYNRIENIKIDAVDYNIPCKYLNGKINFVGIYGLTGNFQGWFSYDKYAVPIKANLQVYVGSISVELIDWRRNLWNPPRT